MGVQKRKGVLDLETHDMLLASNKLLSAQLKQNYKKKKKMEAKKLEQLSSHGLSCELCEQTHRSGVCLPQSLGLSQEQEISQSMRIQTS